MTNDPCDLTKPYRLPLSGQIMPAVPIVSIWDNIVPIKLTCVREALTLIRVMAKLDDADCDKMLQRLDTQESDLEALVTCMSQSRMYKFPSAVNLAERLMARLWDSNEWSREDCIDFDEYIYFIKNRPPRPEEI